MQTKHIMITGVLAWLGGLGTAVFASSCDTRCPDPYRSVVDLSILDADGKILGPDKLTAVTYVFHSERDDPNDVTNLTPTMGACASEDCDQWFLEAQGPGVFDVTATVCGQPFSTTVEIPADEMVDECLPYVKAAALEVDTSACEARKSPPHGPGPDDLTNNACDRQMVPSVWVNVLRRTGGDMLQALTPTDGVWFEAHGRRRDALCVGSSHGEGCIGWIAGLDTPGRYTVGTTYCEDAVMDSVEVTVAPDGCHVDTQWVTLIVDSRGCLQAAPDGQPDFEPPIKTPDADPDALFPLRDVPPNGDPTPPGR